MDVWLLAAQIMVSGGAGPSTALGGNWGAESQEPPAPQFDRYIFPEQTAYPAPEPNNNPSMAVVAGASPPRAPSMAEAVNRWPSPSQVMPPSRHPSPPLGSAHLKPVTGSQLYQFRSAALEAGELYAQALPQQYLSRWQRAFTTPTHSEWQGLLAAEAATMARRQGEHPLAVIVGDSLALWLPVDNLPSSQLWLNQSISGETTAQILRRLTYFADTRPQTIHLMAGINDLKTGVPEAELLENMHQLLIRLQQQHPQAQLVVYSVLPTRLQELPSDRIQRVNQRLAALTAYQGATFIDLQPTFSDRQGLLRLDLTTDGLHLSPQGYSLWQAALMAP